MLQDTLDRGVVEGEGDDKQNELDTDETGDRMREDNPHYTI